MDKKPSARILVVDDVKTNLLHLKHLLSNKYGYSVATADNGKTALKRAQTQKLDLILLDVIMPDISGFEVCKILKSKQQTKDIPVIFLTSKTDNDSLIEGFKCGAVDYVRKPFLEEELISRVRVHIELKQIQNQLVLAKDKAEMATNAKSIFLANMSHEIRTPMNGVVGMVEALKSTPLNEEQKEYLDIIDLSSENLLSVINDILDFSKVEAGQIEFENISFNLKDSIEEVIKMLTFKAGQKNLHLNYKFDKNIPEFLIGDPLRIKQVLINFINNAVKFTTEGEVSVDCQLVSTKDNIAEIKFMVSDTGIGISDKNKVKLFKSFSQADASTTRKYGGTGLGLAISKSLSKMMNGKIGVDSEEGKGSTFWFTAKLVITDEEHIKSDFDAETGDIPMSGLKVLVAEDNAINQRVARFNLEKLDIEVDIAENGEIAFELFKKNNYDIVFMDIQMPVMDGLNATRQIRKYELQTGRSSKIPIIAMTANTLKGDKEDFMDAGLTDYIGKPFKPNELISIINSVTKKT
jgi:signal transduction histidine kinase